MSAPLKILFLHGYTQSGPSFHAKTKALEKALLKALPTGSTLHFPTAPHRLQPADLPGGRAPSGSGDNWSWWQRDAVNGGFDGLGTTWVFLSEYLTTHGPFDGCVGFSQGAALAAMLAAALEPGRARPAGFSTQHAPLRFAACYSGFRAPHADALYEPAIATPVLHFLGSLDTVVEEARSMQLVAACVRGEQRVVFHPGGHYLPAGRQYVGVLLGFVLDCVGGGDGSAERPGLELPF